MENAARRPLVLAVCCTSIVLVVMDISIVNVALPTIRADLDASTAQLQWTIDAYTLVLASFLVATGSLADRFGRRRVFLVGLVAFGVGSALCALAPGAGWLVAARAAQGVGATALNPVAMAIVATTYPEPAERARAVGVFASMSGLALALGPVLGGVLVDSLGWRAVFWVNVPVVVVGVAAAWLVVPESRAARPRRTDLVGQVLVLVTLAGLVAAIIEGGRLGWSSPAIVSLLVVALAAFVGLLVVEPRRRDPLLELHLFRSVPFSAAILTAACGLFGFGAFLFLTTQYLQDERGTSAAEAGLWLLPVGVLVLLLSPVVGRALAAHGPRAPLLVAGTALALAAGATTLLGPRTSEAAVLATFLGFGVFLAALNPPITTVAISGMPASMTGVAASLASVGRQVGTTLGVAVAGAVVATGSRSASVGSARPVWWVLVGLGVVIVGLTWTATTAWARGTARRAASTFDRLERGGTTRATDAARR